MTKSFSVQLKVNSRKVAEDLKKIISSLDGFYLRNSEVLGPCDVLIFEIGDDPKREIQQIHSIRTSGSIQELFLTSSSLDPEILIQARRAGGKKIFVQPLKKEEVRNALLKFREKEEGVSSSKKSQKNGKIIYVIGCKGGVGTTTVALNLASSLAEMDQSRSVVLTDLTLPFGDIPVLLNIKPSPNLAQIVKNISRIEPSFLKSILFEHSMGFFVLPSPSEETWGYRVNPDSLERLLSVMQKALDFIVIDGGKSFTDTSARALKMAEEVLMVTGTSSPCIANMKRLLSIFQAIESCPQEKVKVVVNRYQKNSSIPLDELEKELNKKIFWTIPNDFQTAMEAVNQGKTLAEVGSRKEISMAFRRLAAFLLVDGRQEKEKNEFWKKSVDKSKWPHLALHFNYKLKSP